MMKLLKKLGSDKSLVIISIIVAVLFGAIGVYGEFFRKLSPDLNYVITSNYSVLELKKNIKNLDIIYNGESLRKKNIDLKLISFKVINQGHKTIPINFYDPEEPIGFAVRNGRLATTPEIISTSNQYLSDSLKLTKPDNSKVYFSNEILEPGAYYEVRTLILYKKGVIPSIRPLGKIAEVDHIDVIPMPLHNKVSSKYTLKDMLYPYARFFYNGILFFILAIASVVVLEYLKALVRPSREQKYRKMVDSFTSARGEETPAKCKLFTNMLIYKDPYNLFYCSTLLEDEEKILKLSEAKDLDPTAERYFDSGNAYTTDRAVFLDLREYGIVTVKDRQVEVDQESAEFLNDFIVYLISNRTLSTTLAGDHFRIHQVTRKALRYPFDLKPEFVD